MTVYRSHPHVIRVLAAPLVIAALVLFAVVTAKPQAASAQAPVECQKGAPAEWSFIAERSSATVGQQFLCNYSVHAEGSGGSGPAVGGTAITVEYFCTATEAASRFKSVADSPRKTETQRIAGELLVIEEGPNAKNPDNPQSNGVRSTFFDGEFNLFEKEWRLLNPQIFATIVVITNRGKVPEDKRFGVDDVEPIARGLANFNASGAGCPIPGLDGGEDGGGGTGIIVVVGGIALVAGAAALAVKSRKPKGESVPATATASTAPPTDDLDLAILQLDAKEFDVDDANPATVTLTGWNVGTDGIATRVPMTIWITAPLGCGVLVVPDQGDGELIATISVDAEQPSTTDQVELTATGVWKGKQISETLTVRFGGALELRLY